MLSIKVPIPRPYAAFRSIRSIDSPFEALRRFVAREVSEAGLSFERLFLHPADFAEFQWQVWKYLHLRGGREEIRLEELSQEGRTAPRVSADCVLGVALAEVSQ